MASTNLIWLLDNEKELVNSFGQIGFKSNENLTNNKSNEFKIKIKQMFEKDRTSDFIKNRKY